MQFPTYRIYMAPNRAKYTRRKKNIPYNFQRIIYMAPNGAKYVWWKKSMPYNFQHLCIWRQTGQIIYGRKRICHTISNVSYIWRQMGQNLYGGKRTCHTISNVSDIWRQTGQNVYCEKRTNHTIFNVLYIWRQTGQNNLMYWQTLFFTLIQHIRFGTLSLRTQICSLSLPLSPPRHPQSFIILSFYFLWCVRRGLTLHLHHLYCKLCGNDFARYNSRHF